MISKINTIVKSMSLLNSKLFNLLSASRPNSVVDIEPKRETAVRVGESLQILCKASQPLRVCRVEIPGEGSMVLRLGEPAEDGIEYIGAGYNEGQCGVRIAKVKESHDGTFKCSLTTTSDRQEATASLKIIVASKSLPFILIRWDSSSTKQFKVETAKTYRKEAVNVSVRNISQYFLRLKKIYDYYLTNFPNFLLFL